MKDFRLQMEVEVRLKNSLMAGAFMKDVEDSCTEDLE